MKAFTQPLSEYAQVRELEEAIQKNKLPIRVTGCTDSQKANLIAAVSSDKKSRLVLVANELKAKELRDDLKLYDKNVLLYPAKDIIFYSADVHSNAIVKERLKCIARLLEGEPVTVVMSISAAMDKILPLERIRENIIEIESADNIDLTRMEERLTAAGYQRADQVEEPGEFAVRGGILDVFPLNCETPYRVELWGDEIDTIRMFDASSQRSIENVSGIKIFPAVEYVLSEEELASGLKRLETEEKKYEEALRKAMKTEAAARIRKSIAEFREDLEYLGLHVGIDSYIDYFAEETVSIIDYFSGEDAVIFLDEPARAEESLSAASLEFSESMAGRLENGYILPGQVNAAFEAKSLFTKLSGRSVVMLSGMEYRFGLIPAKDSIGLTVKSISSFNGNYDLLIKELLSWKKQKYRVILLTSSHSRAERLANELCESELTAFCPADESRLVQPGEIMVVSGGATRGFEYPLIKFAVICESELFGKQKQVKKKKLYEGERIADFSKLENGDFVVHESYGVGIYRGIEKIEVDHVIKDYVKVEYAAGGTLFVRASALNALQKYTGPEGREPKLNKLNSNEWKNTTAKVKSAVKEIAGDLIRLYALRQAKHGFEFGPDTVWQTEFEEQFPYEETADQLKAIEDTKRDMESSAIMDRLICGDVGYGKTEIAIRAAFKAVQDGKQVAILVPTTILAQQHYNTFSQRMKDYPVSVDMLSRFRTPGQQKQALARLKSGELDIIIGTHRLLSKDVVFKNLGLLVVDEEQRFGVSHKEKIKQMKGDVDVLTLTATPIPRTLHMSLIGIRDMSVLDEAPVDRLPIQTFVMEHNDEIIREAITRELARGGQVYYVFNRVQGIAETAAMISKLVPEATVVYAHGQMNEHELEKIMLDFVNGEIDVLVATTIIETGLDISNVNTIVIDDADRMGLSQLYQLRGRVGRASRTAYAFLMYRRDKSLREVAEKRLAAIKEYTELGSGFKIAMKDLEIRGAGNLLGAEQSGHMAAVGYDLYCKLLNTAVKALKLGTEEEETFETAIDLDMDAYIPSTYIKNEMYKLDMYKRIAGIRTQDEMNDILEEMTDRYSDPPKPVNNLVNIALLKEKAHDVYITGVTQKGNSVKLELYPKAKLDVARWNELVERFPGRLKTEMGKNVVLMFTLYEKPGKRRGSFTPEEVFEQIGELFGVMKSFII